MNYEFYETPQAFSNWLFDRVDIRGRVFEPCVGSGAILRARWPPNGVRWFTNDLDERWPADVHKDARDETLWQAHEFDWTVSNPPFAPAISIIEQALRYSRVGVAMHLRASIHEVLKTGIRRTWMREHRPTGILWLPRFAYQRSPTTGKWTTDSVCACWVVWLKPDLRPHYMIREHRQFIDYAPASVLSDLLAETPAYRARMDELIAGRQTVSA